MGMIQLTFMFGARKDLLTPVLSSFLDSFHILHTKPEDLLIHFTFYHAKFEPLLTTLACY